MSDSWIDPAIVARMGTGGLLAGGSIGALANMVRHMNMLKRDAKRKAEREETDKDTIVLTLPRQKSASALDSMLDASGPFKKAETATSRTFAVNRGGQSRETDTGRFGSTVSSVASEKAAGSGWPTLTAGGLAAIGGTVGGVALMNRLYDKYRENKLKREIAAAKQEYIDALAKSHKTASAESESESGSQFSDALFGDIPGIDGFSKEASAFGMLNYPMAAFLMLSALGGGSVGYLTKKVLDEKLREKQDRGLDIPKVKRIVFRTQPVEGQAEPEDAEKAAELRETVMAGFGVMLDKLSGLERFVGHPEVKAAFETSKVTKDDLMKEAADYWDYIVGHLQENPKLRKSLALAGNKYMTSNPVMRGINSMALRTGLGQSKADEKIYGMIERLRQGPAGGIPSDLSAPKVAAAPISSVLAGMGGGAVSDIDPDELAQAVVDEQEARAAERDAAGQTVDGKIRLEAVDPHAAEYLAAHQDRIKALVRRLAAQGTI